ncbi:carbohydrate ABC transporter substrate-binding protein [Parasedimentitalea maritima]|uniref:Probable sugar-binding periplasmic protein n=1 Tax=Parasedimentitalea maritima TaxID=2578117 RepID=A0ABY2USL0_9RHOB|nr:ABC transporter substrate-binding protein [Zongyanglinia marina]TLP61360.1 carbohydrate ABC transporter substrate-binding protein [Zongyanglinia marina]
MKTFARALCGAVSMIAVTAAAPALAEPKAEVLHYWTSGGEAKAVQALQEAFAARGGEWVDAPVAGGGGDAQAAVLRARVLAGDPPAAVQIKGPNIQEWAEAGALGDLTAVATAQDWDKVLPEAIQNIVKYEGKYVAVPVNVHRVDWIWANPEVLAKVGAEVPTTWEEFNETADKLQAAGIIPLAHGGQPWQDATVFETVVLGIGGTDFYRKALVELDMDALGSDTMVAVFDQMRKMRGYVDPDFPGRDWNLATAMVMRGEAAMQIMGDWAKGEFAAAGKVPGVDYVCASTPSDNGYLLNSDSFAMFNVSGDDNVEGQAVLAELILGTEFQETFNLFKGSIPARTDVPRAEFDDCAIKSMDDMVAAAEGGTLLGSMAHEIAQAGAVRGAFIDVATAHFNSDMSSQDAVDQLVKAIKLAQ